jgi:hypothetical protein
VNEPESHGRTGAHAAVDAAEDRGYLGLCWRELNDGSYESIWFALVTAGGERLGAPILVSRGTSPHNCQVAWTGEEFVVAWHNSDPCCPEPHHRFQARTLRSERAALPTGRSKGEGDAEARSVDRSSHAAYARVSSSAQIAAIAMMGTCGFTPRFVGNTLESAT